MATSVALASSTDSLNTTSTRVATPDERTDASEGGVTSAGVVAEAGSLSPDSRPEPLTADTR